MLAPYDSTQPDRADIDSLRGDTVLEFGTNWCGICQAAAPDIEAALQSAAPVRHLRVEDGKGRPLGRSFAVKLWPTLVVLRDGREIARVVRPRSSDEVMRALEQLRHR
jgi:thioredoxin 1